MIDQGSDRGALIRSFPTHSQSYTYDQALAIIAFSEAGDRKSARTLIKAVTKLILPDGSLYFSYNLDGTSIYPSEGDKRFAGAVAWMAIALSQYQNAFDTDEFRDVNTKILTFLAGEMKTLSLKGAPYSALRFNPTDVAGNGWDERKTAALEHNLDAYSAFTGFAALNPGQTWEKEISSLRSFSLAMWDNGRSHFWSGANIESGSINKSEYYLDNQTWSLLALEKKYLAGIDSSEALKANCESLYVEHEGVTGFMDSRPSNGQRAAGFVWSEGTLGQILAMKKNEALFRKKESCEKKNADDFLKSVEKMAKSDGGIAYATTTSNPDFTTASSVAGTAWMYFAKVGFNPFELKAQARSVASQKPKTSRRGQ